MDQVVKEYELPKKILEIVFVNAFDNFYNFT